MRTPTRSFVLGDAVQWGFGWLAAEWRLAAPVALACFALPGMALQLLAPQMQQAAADPARMGPALAWLVPVLLVGLYGGLAITIMALSPGGSVGEALGRAARRYGVLLGALGLVFLGLVLALSIFSVIGAASGLSVAGLARTGQMLVVTAMVLVAARLLPLVPVAGMEAGGSFAALRRAAALCRGQFGRTLALVLLMLVLAPLLTFLAQAAIGTVVRVLALTTSGGDVAAALGALILSMIGATISTACYVAVAGVYRALAR